MTTLIHHRLERQAHARHRSSSTSSSASSQRSTDSWGVSTSTTLALEAEHIKGIFASLNNATIANNGLLHGAITVPLSFDKDVPFDPYPKRTAKRAATADLNPSAAPFTPSNGFSRSRSSPTHSQSPEPILQQAAYADSVYEVISTHAPQTSQDYNRPPGLPELGKNPTCFSAPAQSSPILPLPSSLPTFDSPQYAHLQQLSEVEVQDAIAEPVSHEPPAWYSSFLSGLHPGISSQIRGLHAQVVVSSISAAAWASMHNIDLLASQFVSQAYLATEVSGTTIAEFARAVRDAFEGIQNKSHTAEGFSWSLRHHSLQAFMTCWEQAADPSQHHPDEMAQHVVKSISLTRFLADLFKMDLISKVDIQNCMTLLFNQVPAFEEHIVGLAYLALRSGPKLWVNGSNEVDGEAVRGFTGDLEDLASEVRYSLVNARPQYCMGWVEEVRKEAFHWGVIF